MRVGDDQPPVTALGADDDCVMLVARDRRACGNDTERLVAEVEHPAMRGERIDAQDSVGADVGLPTLKDILSELKKPGRDPREAFEPPELVEPLKRLVLRQRVESSPVQGLIERVRLYCSVYDPAARRYRFDYSLIVEILAGSLALGIALVGIVAGLRHVK